MKKNIFILMLVLVLTMSIFIACDKPVDTPEENGGSENENEEGGTTAEKKSYTLTLDMLLGETFILPESIDNGGNNEAITYDLTGDCACLSGNMLVAVAKKSAITTLSAKTSSYDVTVKIRVTDEGSSEEDAVGGVGQDMAVTLSPITLSLGNSYAIPLGTKESKSGCEVSGSAITLTGEKISASAVGEGEIKYALPGVVFTIPVTVVDRGNLNVDDMLIVRGFSDEINYEFSSSEYSGDVSYYAGNSDKISIDAKNNTLKALKTAEEVLVVAVSEYHTDVFSVEIVSKDSIKMYIDAPEMIYSNYPPKQIGISFADERFISDVTFETNNSSVFVEDGKIYATGNFNGQVEVTVTATTEFTSQQFTVNVSTYDHINAETKVQYYEDYIIKPENKGGTIFVGDSYFDGYKMNDLPFWKDFYTDNAADEKFFLMGLSQSQIETLEIVSERIVYPMEPKEIVVHIGFNDVHHGNLTVNELYDRIIALCEQYKERLPDVTVYFMGVEPKKNGYTAGTDYYETSTFRATALTEKIVEYAENTDWFVYLDTMPIFVNSNGTINQSSYLSTDLSHPTLEAYDRIREVFRAARRKVNG